MRVLAYMLGVSTVVAGLSAAERNAEAQNTVADVCQRWVCDRADLTEGTSTADIATCTVGDLQGPGRANSLKLVNLYRFLAGMPAVTEDPSFDGLAQACSIIQAANGLTHTPATTAACYTATGATASNMSSICSGQSVGCIDLYMNDSGGSGFGHRTWIFSNMLGPVGFGQTGSGGRTKTASCFYQVGGTGKAGIPYVAWPPPGPVPLAAITATKVDSAGWSVQSDTINLMAATATVTDGTTSLPVTVTPNLPPFGARYAMEILPNGWTSQAGHSYAVSVGGTATPIAYTVQVVDCSSYTTSGCASDGGIIVPAAATSAPDAGAGDATTSSGGGSSDAGAVSTGEPSDSGIDSGVAPAVGADAGRTGPTGAMGSASGGTSGSNGSSGMASGSGTSKPGGCACGVIGGTPGSRWPAWAVALALAAGAAARRRRRRAGEGVTARA